MEEDIMAANASLTPDAKSADTGAEPSGVVRVYLAEREDGGLRVWSDDEPGLILSGHDADAVSQDIWRAIKALRAYRAERRR